MKRYTSCLVFAAWLCVSAKAEEDTYVPPVPLHEAVTTRTTATDINDASLTGEQTDASPPQSDASKMSEITGGPEASNAAPVAAEMGETANEPMPAEMMQSKKSLVTDPIAEMMGGEFNTEVNQRMADSFLSVRSRVLRLKANRDM
ncbi:hypothetical protein, conserved [Eimeria tenella]|uniref:Uncharacterized protein n=1 Tax=Eimeria tenella TaxID=5802 RepID=U6KQX3_EIMTE|nr:hypothetical protein, conserved [Eimeria tenella]CDJ39333.1 hypothetical protein, conserved [Eimeria tenella]|eukprot:XP_013230088.1 hypothetical protein, conserved [Eimeria tenella]